METSLQRNSPIWVVGVIFCVCPCIKTKWYNVLEHFLARFSYDGTCFVCCVLVCNSLNAESSMWSLILQQICFLVFKTYRNIHVLSC